ncbi:hypothetical protein NSND_50747 [Nitrospira sp. ND1]|nr:hypothetical protein NSND_50747 [Nitrospira sp. ND1]
MNNHKPVLNQGQALKSNILTWREFIPPVSPTPRCLRLVHRQPRPLTHRLPLIFLPHHAADGSILSFALSPN